MITQHMRCQWHLTAREMDILQLVAEGCSAKEAARVLGLRPRTVERHIDNARLKLHARNRIHLVTLALTSGAIGRPAHEPHICDLPDALMRQAVEA